MAVVNAAAKQPPVQLESSPPPISMAARLPVEKGRELARLQALEMIRKIQHRARLQRMNRGLTISLPYFDDATEELRWREMVIIPRGRIPFVPAFVVLAAQQEMSRVEDESRLSETTRAHLITQLEILAEAFRPAPSSVRGC